jgi:hypothetical protein
MKRTASTTLAVRVSPELYKSFKQKSTKFGGQAVVMRELLLGFVESRVTIQAPKQLKESLYV